MERTIVVSKHACERMRERFPHVRAFERTAEAEVREALAAGRRSKTRPAWASISTADRVKGKHSARFVWTEDLGRCYAVRPKLINGRRGVMVLTVFPPETRRD